MANLRIEYGGRTVTTRILGTVVRLGRDADCDLAVDHPDVAAVHVTIEALPAGGHKLTDANSGRPTKVNGLVVKRVSLKSGDVVEIGPARLTYLPEPAVTAVASSRAAPGRAARPPSGAVPSPVRRAVPASSGAPVPEARASERASSFEGNGARGGPKVALTRVLAGLGVFALAGAGIWYAVRSGGDGGAGDMRAYRERLDLSTALVSEDVDLALARLDELARPDVPLEGIRREARREAEHLRLRIAAAAKAWTALESEAADLDLDRLDGAHRALVDTYGAAIAKKHAASLERARAAYRNRAAGRELELTQRAEALLGAGKFGEAAGLYETFEAESAWNEVTRRIVDAGRANVAERAGAAWKNAAGQAAEIAATKSPRAAAMWIRAQLPGFAGTPLARALADRAAMYDRQSASAPDVVAAPAATPASATGPSAPSAPTPGPVARAQPAFAVLAKLESLLADADAKASARRFVEALAVLDEASALAAGSAAASRVAGAREDVAVALDGVRLLATTIREHPERFERFEVTGSFAPSLVGADDQFIDAVVAGGRTRLPWTSFDGARFARLVERARVAGRASLPLASLLHETAADEAAERALSRVVEDGGDKPVVDALLARWRGEPVPAGGYVTHAGRLVSPVERDRLVLDVRIASACAKVAAKEASARKVAYDELLSIGAPARDAFVRALLARRGAAVAEVSSNKAFTSGRIRQKLQAELEKRRVAALELIEDEKAYPYPYSERHEGQKEVDERVDLVRQVWERPFDLVMTWEKHLSEAMALVTEVDEVLAKAQDGYTADLESVKSSINRSIDVPGIVPDEVSKKVLAFNEKVATTSTPQEKENVRAVNGYRIMMGRTAVKIDERLVRAARGHSREMRLKNYFAHESPTPGLESPGKRCAREGYGGGTGENIAWGVTSGRAAFDGWFHSSGHHRNMVNKGWTEMGCGRSGPGHWTQNFGAMTGHGTKEPEPLPPPGTDVAPEPEGPDGMPAEGSATADPAMGG